MNANQKIIIANLVGIVVLILGMAGITVDESLKTQIIAGLGAMGTVINLTIAALQQKKSPDDHQRGFAAVPFLFLLAMICIGVLLAGCASTANSPRQSLLAAYASTQTAAQSIAIAKRNGVIDAQTRDRLLTEVREVRDLLDTARTILAQPQVSVENENKAVAALQHALNILLVIQSNLPVEEAAL